MKSLYFYNPLYSLVNAWGKVIFILYSVLIMSKRKFFVFNLFCYIWFINYLLIHAVFYNLSIIYLELLNDIDQASLNNNIVLV